MNHDSSYTQRNNYILHILQQLCVFLIFMKIKSKM